MILAGRKEDIVEKEKSMREIEIRRQSMISSWNGRRFTNMLDEMMDLQTRFVKKFFDPYGMSEKDRVRWTKELMVCLMAEMSETLNWTCWKHWKNYHGKKNNDLEIQYELVDMLHFLMDLMILWKMDVRTVFSMYVQKSRENFRRQKEEYR